MAGKKEKTSDEGLNELDFQMEWIKAQIGPHVANLKSQSCPLAALAFQAYEMVKAKIEKIVNLDFGSGRLVLVGGIQINMAHDLQDHFLPLMFDIRQKGAATINMMSKFTCAFTQNEASCFKHLVPSPRRSSGLGLNSFEAEIDGNFSEWKNTKAADFDRSAMVEADRKALKQHTVFSWLTWSPEPGSRCFKTLHSSFPGVLPGASVHCRIKSILVDNYGLTPENTLFGSSICPDEINNTATGLSGLMSRFWGKNKELFPMGGLGGAPFTGKTGFKAFSHHVPEGGNIVILYGPHVAVSDTGAVGKYLRDGQEEYSTACGAVIGAYNACCAMHAGEAIEFDEADIQMAWIKTQIAPHVGRIKRQEVPMAALAYQAFESVKAKIHKVVNTEFGSGKLVLVGGIQLNLPPPCGDHFLPMSFEIHQAGQPIERLEEAFHIPLPGQDDNFHHHPVVGA
jgi:hypothetical protein